MCIMYYYKDDKDFILMQKTDLNDTCVSSRYLIGK